MNNADYGLSLQKMICEKYGLEINDWAASQFKANYNSKYDEELNAIINTLFKKIKAKPICLLTYTRVDIKGNKVMSPHNFMLDNGKTLSIRTTKSSYKVAPRIVGQAGFSILNEYFAEIYGDKICNQQDVKKLIFEHIHEILPVFIDNLFQSDYTVFISRKNIEDIQIISAEEVTEYSFSRDDFQFTRDLPIWNESTTLKYHGKSIAEIQTHKERTFKFRFIISSIPQWFKTVRETTETLGISAEGAICDYFELKKPESFANRVMKSYVDRLMPVIAEAFENMPGAVKHSGSTIGERGGKSKCSYDFILEGEKTLSLKTNKGKMVCPPEVGQPGSKTCLLYFKDYFSEDITEVTREDFKQMVLSNIEKIMPIYVKHLFESDWLLWIYEVNGKFEYFAVSKNEIKDFEWKREKFLFTKKSVEEWKESNTVKYDGISIGEFQVHQNRNCYKFRFNMQNLLKILL